MQYLFWTRIQISFTPAVSQWSTTSMLLAVYRDRDQFRRDLRGTTQLIIGIFCSSAFDGWLFRNTSRSYFWLVNTELKLVFLKSWETVLIGHETAPLSTGMCNLRLWLLLFIFPKVLSHTWSLLSLSGKMMYHSFRFHSRRKKGYVCSAVSIISGRPWTLTPSLPFVHAFYMLT